MRLYVGVTDGQWFRFLRERAPLDEVNFWQPSGSRGFRALSTFARARVVDCPRFRGQ